MSVLYLKNYFLYNLIKKYSYRWIEYKNNNSKSQYNYSFTLHGYFNCSLLFCICYCLFVSVHCLVVVLN